jgi:hypothetical protein
MEDPSGYLQRISFERQQQRTLAANLPLEILREAAIGRGLIPDAAAAAVGSEVELETAEAPAFADSLGNFLDPEAKLGVTEQMSFMQSFWGKLGYEPPALTADQLNGLQSALRAAPGLRVVPTPLLPLSERKAITAKTNDLLPKKFTFELELWAPDDTWEFAELLRDPQSTVEKDGTGYGLRYRLPSGLLVDRATYVEELKTGGHAIEVEDGTVWTFPVMDVRPQTQRTSGEAGDVYTDVAAVNSPESLLTIQLLHLMNGSANSGNWELNLANEVVCELNEEDNPKALAYIASIAWLKAWGKAERIHANFWEAGISSGSFGTRFVTDGLVAKSN